MTRFEQACRDAGVRLTHQRMEIFREVAQAVDHPDAELVYKRVRERTRFDANLTRHHHFVCGNCGSTRDFYSEDLDDIKLPSSAKALGRIETTLVEVRGVCRECAGNTTRSRDP